MWSIVAQIGTNILIFYIFESGAESGAKCSAESGAKEYFMRVFLNSVAKWFGNMHAILYNHFTEKSFTF